MTIFKFQEDGKQLGLFFFSKEDAEELIATVILPQVKNIFHHQKLCETVTHYYHFILKYTDLQIKEANPKLGKQTRILTTTMDSVYNFAVTPRDQTGTEGVTFRFVPDAGEVESALELYKHAGIAATGRLYTNSALLY